jgi:hypothetical protein
MEISKSWAMGLILLMREWCKEAICSVAGTDWWSNVDLISAAGWKHAASCSGQHKSWTGHRWQHCRARDIPHVGGGTGRGLPMEDRKWTQGHADSQACEYSSFKRSPMTVMCLNLSMTVAQPCRKVGIRNGILFVHIHLTPLISATFTDNILHVCYVTLSENKIYRIKITVWWEVIP